MLFYDGLLTSSPVSNLYSNKTPGFTILNNNRTSMTVNHAVNDVNFGLSPTIYFKYFEHVVIVIKDTFYPKFMKSKVQLCT